MEHPVYRGWVFFPFSIAPGGQLPVALPNAPCPGSPPLGCGTSPGAGAALRPLLHLPAPASGTVASGCGAEMLRPRCPGSVGICPAPGRCAGWGGSGDAVASGAVWRSPLIRSWEGAGGFLGWELRGTGTLGLLGAAQLVRAEAPCSTSLPGLDPSVPQKDPKFYLQQHQFICVAARSFHESGRQTRPSDPELRCRKSGVKKAPVAPADLY